MSLNQIPDFMLSDETGNVKDKITVLSGAGGVVEKMNKSEFDAYNADKVSLINFPIVVPEVDDTARIQRALNTGKSVFVSSSSPCTISQSLIMFPNQILYGESYVNKAVATKESLITLASGSNCDMIKIAPQCGVEFITLDGNKTNQTLGSGISFNESYTNVEGNCNFKGLTMRNMKGDGIYIHPQFLNNTFTRCMASSCGGKGFSIYSSDNHFYSCDAFNNAYGFYVNNVQNNFYSCLSYWNTIGSYLAASVQMCNFNQCSFDYNYQQGMVMDGCKYNNFYGTRFGGNARTSESFDIQVISTISDNTFYDTMFFADVTTVPYNVYVNTGVTPMNLVFMNNKIKNPAQYSFTNEPLKMIVKDFTTKASISARIYHNTSQSIVDSTWTPLAFNSERFDTDTMHDNVTNNLRLTCKTEGRYIITGNVAFASNSVGTRMARILLNGITPIIMKTINPVTGSSTRTDITTIYDLAVNDYIQLDVFQSSGGALSIEASANYSPELSIARIV